MGSYSSKKELTDKALFEVMAIFKEIDTDQSGNLSREECVLYLKSSFPFSDSNKMLNEINLDGDDNISYDEWKSFWEYLYNNNWSEEMIICELNKLKTSKKWVLSKM